MSLWVFVHVVSGSFEETRSRLSQITGELTDASIHAIAGTSSPAYRFLRLRSFLQLLHPGQGEIADDPDRPRRDRVRLQSDNSPSRVKNVRMKLTSEYIVLKVLEWREIAP
jgi:hypothetical protein